MSFDLEGIPISEEQCIGESLPYINSAFETLCSSVINLSSFDILTAQADLSAMKSYTARLSSRISIPDENQTGYGIGIKTSPSALFDLTTIKASIDSLNATQINSSRTITQDLTGFGSSVFNKVSADTFSSVNGLSSQGLIHFTNANIGVNTYPTYQHSFTVYGNSYFDGQLYVRTLSADEFNIGIGDVATTGRIVAIGLSQESYIGYDKETPTSSTPAAAGNIGISVLGWDGETSINSYCGKIVLPNTYALSNSSNSGTAGFVKTYKINNAFVKSTDVVNVAVSKIGNGPEQGYYCIPFIVRIEDGYFVIGVHTIYNFIGTKTVDKTPSNPLTINFAVIRVPEV